MDINKIILVGRVGRNPEIKLLENTKVAKFSIATSRFYKNSKGEAVNLTDWHNIVCWGKLAELVEKYVEKGNEIGVVGISTNRTYQGKDGKNRYINEILCEEIKFGKKEKEPEQSNDDITNDIPY